MAEPKGQDRVGRLSKVPLQSLIIWAVWWFSRWTRLQGSLYLTKAYPGLKDFSLRGQLLNCWIKGHCLTCRDHIGVNNRLVKRKLKGTAGKWDVHRSFEKFQYIHRTLEDHGHAQGCTHVQEASEKGLRSHPWWLSGLCTSRISRLRVVSCLPECSKGWRLLIPGSKRIIVQSFIENWTNQAETSVTTCDKGYRPYSEFGKVTKQANSNKQ